MSKEISIIHPKIPSVHMPMDLYLKGFSFNMKILGRFLGLNLWYIKH